jgi:uncharacterized protein
MRTKTRPLTDVKTDGGEGVFEAIVAVFGNVDSQGDRILPGAFKSSLARWEASGDPLPVIFNHEWDRLDIGVVEAAEERAKGLWVRAKLDIDEEFPAQIYKRLRRRSLREFSFAFSVIDERRTKDGVNELLELELYEVGPTLKGANPETELLTVKSMPLLEDAKATLAVAWPSKPRLLDALEVLEELRPV